MSTKTMRVKYERSYLVRRVETYVVDLDLDDLTEEQIEALRLGGYDPDLDEIICDDGDAEEEDYEHVDEWDIEAALTVLDEDDAPCEDCGGVMSAEAHAGQIGDPYDENDPFAVAPHPFRP